MPLREASIVAAVVVVGSRLGTTELLAVVVGVAVGMFVVPLSSVQTLALVTFGVPFTILSLQVVWNHAYSE